MDKYDFDKHFLDSNILIGFVLYWDGSHIDCFDYFEEKSDKNISRRVYEECKRVINRYREMQLNFLEEIYTSQDDYRLLIHFESGLNRFVWNYIREKEKKNYYFGLPKKRFVKNTQSFAKNCKYQIHDALTDYFKYESFFKEISESFFAARQQLENICDDPLTIKMIEHPCEEYDLIYPHCKEKLNKLKIHHPDDCILLDCHYFKINYFEEDTAFITKDSTILGASSEIEKLLKGIHIYDV